MYKLKVIPILLACFCGVAAFAAVPQAVEKVAKEMQSDGAEVRAGFAKNLGVFIVAAGNAPITGTKAKAKVVARANAVQQLAGFLGSQISSSTKVRSPSQQ